ncbi:MAG: amylo-alpha-1,6-glucosidase [Synechococcaceae cyanobacterium SM2_3_1]|nr:amylo-alpha-1,6-glucosidase [Synechococcaceae cyanobacterium SM2_3_1]
MTLILKSDDLFLITDQLGMMPDRRSETPSPRSSLGLFCHDTRYLSHLEWRIGGQSPLLIESTAQGGYILSVLSTNPALVPEKIASGLIKIEREILLHRGLFEELQVTYEGLNPVSLELSLSFAADFVDLFEVRGWDRPRRGDLLRQRVEGSGCSLAYQGVDRSIMESCLRFMDQQPDILQGHTALWHLHLDAHATCRISYRVELLRDNRSVSQVPIPATLAQAKAAEAMEAETWRQQITRIRTDNSDLNQVIQQAERDIYLLRQSFGSRKTLSAGIPWYCTLFGRDSLITAAQVLILDPSLARETLQILAAYQGQQEDEWREEEPGKILHELRLGEMARCGEIPHTPYYGTIDATPLWLMLYTDYFTWTCDQEALTTLWPHALAAMDWIDRHLHPTGYLAYQRRSRLGLENQGWKDSGDCIVDRHGRLAPAPIALCEVQGYVYAAKQGMSRLAHWQQQPDLAQRWQAEARALRERFNRDFWVADLDYCALALDGEGQPVDAIASNPGHCLHCGILFADQARSVAERLMAPDLFNGWGIRTLSSLSPAYNPMGYHTGSVWPHDNSLIASGLRAVGCKESALEVAQGLLEMTVQQPYFRPPELFCGYERTETDSPVLYPIACSPQAWATGTLFQLLQTLINLRPDAPSNSMRILDPLLPASIRHLTLENLKVGDTVLDLEVRCSANGQATATCQVVSKRGNLRVAMDA